MWLPRANTLKDFKSFQNYLESALGTEAGQPLLFNAPDVLNVLWSHVAGVPHQILELV